MILACPHGSLGHLLSAIHWETALRIQLRLPVFALHPSHPIPNSDSNGSYFHYYCMSSLMILGPYRRPKALAFLTIHMRQESLHHSRFGGIFIEPRRMLGGPEEQPFSQEIFRG